MDLLTQILIFSLSPFAYISLGSLLWRLAAKLPLLKIVPKEQPSLLLLLLPGIAIFNYLTLVLKTAGAPWFVLHILAATVIVIDRNHIANIINSLKTFNITPHFGIWFFVVLLIGISILNTTNNFDTYWVNAYGDYAFHIGMISSFVFGDNFPPQNHILAGETLSYPFFINLWSATLWSSNPTPLGLSFTFLYQWLVIFIPVYFLVSGDRAKLVPWLILFGGGTFLALGVHSSQNIKDGFPWSVLLTTIWIPQRSAMMGLLAACTIIKAFDEYLKEPKNELCLFWAGATAALMPLVHTHILMVLGAYVGLVILLKYKSHALRPLLIFALPASLSAHALVFLLGKESIFRVTIGWYPWESFPGLLGQILGAMKMWAANAGHLIFSGIILYYLSKRRIEVVAILILFILGNIFQAAIWPWDQIKIFMTIYILMATLWISAYEKSRSIPLNILLFILIIPSLCEVKKVISENNMHAVYSKDDWLKAQEIIKVTEPTDIILSAPDHNSLITLTGRRLFMGFPGTLFSHGSRYEQREKIMDTLTRAVNCRTLFGIKHLEDNCPDYLLWAHNEIKRWNSIDYKSSLQLEPTPLSFLYKIKKTSD